MLGSAGVVLAGCEASSGLTPVTIGEEGLKHRAARKGLLIGAAVEPWQLWESEFKSALVSDCHMVVAENALKWRSIQRTPGQYNFYDADKIADFAAANGMVMRGHVLVWHEHSPWWLTESSRKRRRKLLHDYIHTVAGRYRGRMHSWDVVIEAVEPKDGRADGLRESQFLRALGPDYLAMAYTIAAEADPTRA